MTTNRDKFFKMLFFTIPFLLMGKVIKYLYNETIGFKINQFYTIVHWNSLRTK